MWKCNKEDGFWQREIYNKRKSGDLYMQWLSITPVKNDVDEIKSYVGIFSEMKKSK